MLEFWFMLPVAFLIATIAMSSGVGGAAMFTPFFYLFLNLPASLAVGIGLLIEIFGFGSGLLGFMRKKLVEYKVGFSLLCFTIPAAIVGALLSGGIADWIIMSIITLVLVVLGIQILAPEDPTVKHHGVHEEEGHGAHKCYKEPESGNLVGFLSALGGLLGGLVSTGIGEINEYLLLEKYEMHGPAAAGTSVFVVALTVLVGSVTHAYNFFTHQVGRLAEVTGILVFTLPGVLLGAQAGVWLSQRLDEKIRKKSIGVLFLLLAVFTAVSVFS